MWLAVPEVGQSTLDQGHTIFVIPLEGGAALIQLFLVFARSGGYLLALLDRFRFQRPGLDAGSNSGDV